MYLKPLSEFEKLPKRCYVLIRDCVMGFEDNDLIYTCYVDGRNEAEKAQCFAEYLQENGLKLPKRLIYDDTGMYSPLVIEDMGYFTDDPLDGADEEEIEDWASYAEYMTKD